MLMKLPSNIVQTSVSCMDVSVIKVGFFECIKQLWLDFSDNGLYRAQKKAHITRRCGQPLK